MSVPEHPVPFNTLPIAESVQRGLDAIGFEACTPIQARSLPISLSGRDVAGQAQTGTGKTAAFLITVFTRLLKHPERKEGPRALIIAPTRELVVQILQDAQGIGEFTGLTFHAVYGGVDYGKQREILRDGIDVLIGTPGRLIDYFKQRVYSLKHAEVLVIDEADRMFDMGFIADLRYLLRRLPPVDKRQSMLFSATLNWDVMELAYEHMNDPVKVAVEPEKVTAEKVEHVLYHVGRHEKLPLLLGLMQREKPERALFFVNTKREAEWLANRLEDNGHHAAALTGDLHQRVRLRVLREFKDGELPFLIATDVASRGLHIEGVTHVFNYDVPQDPEDYVHRIGRTARAGASGKAITLACESYVEALEPIEALIGFRLPAIHVEDDMLVKPAPPTHRARPERAFQRDGGRGRQGREGHGQGRDRRRGADGPPRESQA
ncbi:MAG: DEAD/DEAH box helicase, partial [Deltaproteobacteria bacterium]|nr:DEAD/DEAH box helicase [Deltaproteobacteria bacterium]